MLPTAVGLHVSVYMLWLRAGSVAVPVVPVVIAKPALIEVDVTVSVLPPRLRTVTIAPVLATLTGVSPKAMLAGITSMSIGGGMPVPTSVTDLVSLLSWIATGQLTVWP